MCGGRFVGGNGQAKLRLRSFGGSWGRRGISPPQTGPSRPPVGEIQLHGARRTVSMVLEVIAMQLVAPRSQ